MQRPASAAAASLLEVGTSLKAEIDEAITADPEKRSRAEMQLSDARLHASELGIRGPGTIEGAKWNLAQGRHMEAKGVKTVLDLARVNIYNMELVLRLTLCDDTADGRRTARRTLWRRKCAAAALVGVDDIGELPKLKQGRKPKEERTTKEQDALDVATRWAASRAGTVDEKLATEYAEALAAIARDCVANQQKKKKRRR